MYESTFGQILEELSQGCEVVAKPKLVCQEVLALGIEHVDDVALFGSKALKQAHVSAVSIGAAAPDETAAGRGIGEVRVMAEILERSCSSRFYLSLCDLSPCHRENS
jgi:hypothetical protein